MKLTPNLKRLFITGAVLIALGVGASVVYQQYGADASTFCTSDDAFPVSHDNQVKTIFASDQVNVANTTSLNNLKKILHDQAAASTGPNWTDLDTYLKGIKHAAPLTDPEKAVALTKFRDAYTGSLSDPMIQQLLFSTVATLPPKSFRDALSLKFHYNKIPKREKGSAINPFDQSDHQITVTPTLASWQQFNLGDVGANVRFTNVISLESGGYNMCADLFGTVSAESGFRSVGLSLKLQNSGNISVSWNFPFKAFYTSASMRF